MRTACFCCRTFDSPGLPPWCNDMIGALDIAEKNRIFRTYLSTPHPINMLNRHIGR